MDRCDPRCFINQVINLTQNRHCDLEIFNTLRIIVHRLRMREMIKYMKEITEKMTGITTKHDGNYEETDANDEETDEK